MTTDDLLQELYGVLPEFMDGYLFLGKAVNGEPVALCWCPDEEARLMINAMVAQLAQDGGLMNIQTPTQDDR